MERNKGPREDKENLIVLQTGRKESTSDIDTVRSSVSENRDLFNKILGGPASLAGNSSIPPRKKTSGAQVIKLDRKSDVAKTTKKRSPGVRKIRRPNDGIIVDPTEGNNIPSISGGATRVIKADDEAYEDDRAVLNGYEGVRKVYLIIKNTLPEREFKTLDTTSRAYTDVLLKRMEIALHQLEELSILRSSERGKLMFGEDLDDPRLFNAVASILIHAWPHNHAQKLDDLRVKSMIMMISESYISWTKVLDRLADWENHPTQLGKARRRK